MIGVRLEDDGQAEGPTTQQPQSSKPVKTGTRLEVNPNLSEYLGSYQGTDLLNLSGKGDQLGWRTKQVRAEWP